MNQSIVSKLIIEAYKAGAYSMLDSVDQLPDNTKETIYSNALQHLIQVREWVSRQTDLLYEESKNPE